MTSSQKIKLMKASLELIYDISRDELRFSDEDLPERTIKLLEAIQEAAGIIYEIGK